MAANIQSLIDLLSSKILMYDLSHIQGEQIVSGNPEHCINLLQLAKEISGMMNTNQSNLQASGQLDDDEEESVPEGANFHPDGAPVEKLSDMDIEDNEAV